MTNVNGVKPVVLYVGNFPSFRYPKLRPPKSCSRHQTVLGARGSSRRAVLSSGPVRVRSSELVLVSRPSRYAGHDQLDGRGVVTIAGDGGSLDADHGKSRIRLAQISLGNPVRDHCPFRFRWKRWLLTTVLMGACMTACSVSSSTNSPPPSRSTQVSSTTPATTAIPSTTTTTLPSTTTTAPADAHLTISSTYLSVGELMTVTGTGCPVGYWAEPRLYQVGPSPPAIFHQAIWEDAEAFFQTETGKQGIVAHDGLWTMNGIVPMVPQGTGTLGGTCSPMVDGGEADPVFYYPTLSVKVTSRYRMEVDPGTTVDAGTRLTVTSVGGNCPSFTGTDLRLYSPSDSDVADGTLPIVKSSVPWKSLLTVPRGLKPGHYRLEADCVEGYAVSGSYTPVAITVE